jgi:hypothetical protein
VAGPGSYGRLSPARALLFGTLTVGVLDLLDAIVFFSFRGVAPIRIPQSIAAGLLGRTAAFQGGMQTATIGVLLHFFIAFCVVYFFYRASQWVSFLVRHPWRCGALYGVMVYAFMNLVVIPLSASGGGGIPPLPIALNGILIHIFGVGLPAALFARAARQ